MLHVKKKEDAYFTLSHLFSSNLTDHDRFASSTYRNGEAGNKNEGFFRIDSVFKRLIYIYIFNRNLIFSISRAVHSDLVFSITIKLLIYLHVIQTHIQFYL